MLTPLQLDELLTNGFVRIPGYLNDTEIQAMMETQTSLINDYQNDTSIYNRVAYLSDDTDTRCSNAFMVSAGDSPLPHIKTDSYSTLDNLLQDFQYVLAQINDDCLSNVVNTRAMLNLQDYKAASKPVPWHFDGEYLDMNTLDNDGQIDLKEGLVPGYVAVYTLHNANTLATGVRSLTTGEEFLVESKAGDMFIFDNTAVLHAVPELKKPRAMFGFRNFDYNPSLYTQQYDKDSFVTSNQCFSGFVKRITTAESEAIQEDFIQDWKDNFNVDLKAKF